MNLSKSQEINILKGLGIIAVVMGHAGSPFTPYIYLYHMALFFFITGYLYKPKYEESPYLFFKRKIKTLYIPFIKFELFFLILRNFFITIHFYNTSQVEYIESFKSFLENILYIFTFNYTGDNLLGAIWFLKSLFYVNLLYLLFNIICNKINFKNEFIKTTLVVILGFWGFYSISYGYNPIVYLNPNGNLFLSLILSLFDGRNFLLLAIYHFGFIFKKYGNNIPINLPFTIVSVFLLYLLSFKGKIDVSTYVFVSPIFFFISSLVGIYINIYISSIINKTFLRRYFDYIGRNSLYIMLLHFMSFKLINFLVSLLYDMPLESISGFPVSLYSGYWWFIYTITGIVLPIILLKIYDALKSLIQNKFNPLPE